MSATATLLAESVHQHKALSRRGVLERMFTASFKGMVYNQIWEDPRVDAEAMALDEQSRILTISSGGCNVFNYLVHKPAAVTAVDLNNHHLRLCQLKAAGVRHMSQREFFRFFAEANRPDNADLYNTRLRPHLEDDAREHWENPGHRPRLRYFSKNLYNFGQLGLFLRFIHGISRVYRIDPTEITRATTLEQQREIFERSYNRFFNYKVLKKLTRLPFFLHALGVPPRQYETFVRETNGQVLEAYRHRVRRLACDFPIQDNYFAWQAFARRYDTVGLSALPDYLKPHNFQTLTEHIHKVSTRLTKLTPFLRQQQPGAFNRFVFLDAQDWMTASEITELWSEVARVGGVGSRVIFRTGGAVSPIESSLPPELLARFRYHAQPSLEWHKRDRSSIYGGFHLYEQVA